MSFRILTEYQRLELIKNREKMQELLKGWTADNIIWMIDEVIKREARSWNNLFDSDNVPENRKQEDYWNQAKQASFFLRRLTDYVHLIDTKPEEKLPASMGLYFFVGNRGQILYIGKSVNIRERFSKHRGQDSSLINLMHNVYKVYWLLFDDEILLKKEEERSIKIFRPPFNSHFNEGYCDKDNPKYNVKLKTKLDFQRHSETYIKSLFLGALRDDKEYMEELSLSPDEFRNLQKYMKNSFHVNHEEDTSNALDLINGLDNWK